MESTALFLIELAAVMFMFLGILGEYVGKIYDEVRARPNYVVAEELGVGFPG